MRSLIIIFFSIMLFGISCSKEHDNINIEEEPFMPVTKVEIGSFLITIGENIPFKCTIHDQTYTSDDSGYLLLGKILVDRAGAVVLIESDGYFSEIRHVVPSLGAHLYMEVRLVNYLDFSGINREIEGFNAEAGGKIEFHRTDIEIQPGSMVDDQGNAYMGEVKVYGYNYSDAAYSIHYWNYPQVYFYENDQSKILNLLGGMNMVFFDEMMNPIYIKEGESVKISARPLDTQMSTPPSELDVMYFDYKLREWITIGLLEQDGEFWEGSISKLGSIAWGIKHDSRVAEIKLLTDSGVPVVNNMVQIYSGQENSTNYGYSDSEGNVRFQTPINTKFKTLMLELTNHEDVTNIKEYDEIGIGNGEPIRLDDIIVDSKFYDLFEGEIVDCYGNALSQSAIITEGSRNFSQLTFTQYIFPDDFGQFNFALHRDRNDTGILYAYDFFNDVISSDFHYLLEENEILEFGGLPVCSEFEHFINYHIDGKSYAYVFEGSYSKEFSDPSYLSTFSASSVNEVDPNNKTLFSIEHDMELEINKSYTIQELSIRYNITSTSYTFDCNSDCSHFVQIKSSTPEFYEGLITKKDDTSLEEIIGTFRIPRQ